MPAGRFAPSPSGDLHVGNLRTALLAWLFARSTGRDFLIRMEDLDGRTRPGAAQRQLADVAALGLDWSEPVVAQSDRLGVYRSVVDGLVAAGETFECFCTRREIQDAPTAPHAPPGAYPGTCRDLTQVQRAQRRRERPAAIRLRAHLPRFTVHDTLHGEFTGDVDDFVLLRGDGTPAYNLAVVVDDAAFGIDQVVRGGDLLSSAPRQAYLAQRLGYPVPEYAHVPMVLSPSTGSGGEPVRLSKRDGAITLAQLAERGYDAPRVLGLMAESLNLAGPGEPVTAQQLLKRFDPASLPREPWIFTGV
ncbi:tRNA glutamyl-Q(34) synthetase GluQRS [Gordonia sp. PP30]|uniref:tRNA glutamyl-Q(34) synthetase GluQRS n=1 Tax=Gordonia sp. PP30 TaxID=2935861 RepID=UPI001FFE44C4|nr:tRNA glutamyl-Q(34) synthetase GluQRS [Gordonia sp. PP30]UQE75310.1 tRNA glutamyl-Q(34) synthetase GluQRS [Gordonia sp. PP30]